MPDRPWGCENERLPRAEPLENLVSQSGIILIIKPITKLNTQQVKNNHPLNYAQIIPFSQIHPTAPNIRRVGKKIYAPYHI